MNTGLYQVCEQVVTALLTAKFFRQKMNEIEQDPGFAGLTRARQCTGNKFAKGE